MVRNFYFPSPALLDCWTESTVGKRDTSKIAISVTVRRIKTPL